MDYDNPNHGSFSLHRFPDLFLKKHISVMNFLRKEVNDFKEPCKGIGKGSIIKERVCSSKKLFKANLLPVRDCKLRRRR